MERHVYILERLYTDKNGKNSDIREKALRETLLAVGTWCTQYEVNLLEPSDSEDERKGALPSDPSEKREFLNGLLDWIKEKSEDWSPDRFNLYLHDQPIVHDADPNHYPKFTHFETNEWWLALTKEEFSSLQSTWRSVGLPEDLYYPQESQHSRKEVNELSRTVTAHYSPKQWEQLQTEEDNNK